MSKFVKLNRFIFLLIICLFFNSVVFADGVTQEQIDIANSLTKMGYVKGYPDGDLKLESNITRAEFTVLALRLLDKEHLIEDYKKNTSFNDVSKDYWASAYINIAVKESLIKGYSDNTFRPDNNISHAEILTILIRILDHENTKEAAKGTKWYSYYVNKSKELGISNDISESVTKDAKRVDVFVYMYNSLPVLLDKDY